MRRLSYLLLLLLACVCVQTASGISVARPDDEYVDSIDLDSLTLWDFDIDSSKVVRKKGSVLVIGSGSKIRGCNPFGLNRQRLREYAGVVNEYQRTFPDVQVYFRGIDPTPIRDFALLSFNGPARLGDGEHAAVCLPGDAGPGREGGLPLRGCSRKLLHPY